MEGIEFEKPPEQAGKMLVDERTLPNRDARENQTPTQPRSFRKPRPRGAPRQSRNHHHLRPQPRPTNANRLWDPYTEILIGMADLDVKYGGGGGGGRSFNRKRRFRGIPLPTATAPIWTTGRFRVPSLC
jgi:hypothetical protein